MDISIIDLFQIDLKCVNDSLCAFDTCDKRELENIILGIVKKIDVYIKQIYDIISIDCTVNDNGINLRDINPNKRKEHKKKDNDKNKIILYEHTIIKIQW